jgi:hypothetical protein
MADYSVLADVSATLLATLRENLCPDPVMSPESIALASPGDKNSDFQLGLYLFELRELNEYRTSSSSVSPSGTKRNPPRPYNLRYMLFVNNKAQMAAGAELEQRILGRAIQTVMDHSTLNLAVRSPEINDEERSCGLSLLAQSFEEKTKIWSALSMPYQLAVFLEASPVLVSSRKEEQVSRVVSAEIDVHHTTQR